MNNNKNRKNVYMIFIISFIVAVGLLILSVVKTNAYNAVRHHDTFTGSGLFSSKGAQGKDVYAIAEPRESTWTKIFDLNNEGITEENFQAYTVDFTIANNTADQVSDFLFKLTFKQDTFLLSAWNGALEIHQNVNSNETVDTVPDLREFVPENHILETFTADGETMVSMKPGDYLYYIPSSTMNAMEMPIEPFEATTPGLILYAPIGDNIDDMVLELEYAFHRKLTREPLFWIALSFMAIWALALINVIVTSFQIRKYKKRHERDNEIITESIETFIGFIDAKDPYTNGHSKRVAIYTRRIAEEFGYDGEELERMYYVALLHDCGKIGVPDHILGKPGKLTNEEFEIIKSHTLKGYDILKSFKSLDKVGEGALYHHERYDGHGYPEGRSGKNIPLIARIICIADSYDAMNSDRVYRKKLDKERIISEIEEGKGKQFDPEIADIMLRFIKDDVLSGLV